MMRLAHGAGRSRVPPPLLEVLEKQRRAVVVGLDESSTRRLAEVLEMFELPSMDDSTIWRIGKAADEQLLAELSLRDLAGVSLAAVMIDGKNIGGHRKIVGDRHKTVGGRQVIWALGIAMDGTKIPLAITEDATERGETVEAMIRHMVAERHLDVQDALWVIDGGPGLRAGIRRATNDRAAIQRCIVHKNRNVVMDNLLAAERKAVGSEVYRRLGQAWAESDYAVAAQRLGDVSSWLREQGYEKAADSVLEGAEMTLTLQRLGVDDPVTRRLVNQTNMIESVHDAVDRRADRVKRWSDPPDTMRRRWVAAAIASAERSWHNVSAPRPRRSSRRAPPEPVEPAALERLSLAVLAGRHATVKLELDNLSDRDALVLSSLEVAAGDQGGVYRALTDLRAWANRNGKTLDITEQAIDAAPRPERVRHWIERESTGRTSDLARPRKRPADPLAVVLKAADARLAVGLAEAALEAAPDMVAKASRELRLEAARLWVAAEALGSIDTDVQAWWENTATHGVAHWRTAAGEIAIERERMMRGERPWRHPLAGGRAAVLGEQRTEQLLGESRYRGALIEGAPDEWLGAEEQRIDSVLTGLDEPANRLARAGRAVAASRELDRREQLRRIQQDAGRETDPVAAERSRDPALPLERYRDGLGQRRYGLLQRYAEALQPQLAGLDAATLRHLRDEIGNPWYHLKGASAMRTTRGEERQAAVLRERGKTLREAGYWQRRAQEEPRQRVHDAAKEHAKSYLKTAGGQWEELRVIGDALANERAADGSLDKFIAEHPEAALHHAVQVEIDRRRELDAPERIGPVAAQAPVAAEAGVDMGM